VEQPEPGHARAAEIKELQQLFGAPDQVKLVLHEVLLCAISAAQVAFACMSRAHFVSALF